MLISLLVAAVVVVAAVLICFLVLKSARTRVRQAESLVGSLRQESASREGVEIRLSEQVALLNSTVASKEDEIKCAREEMSRLRGQIAEKAAECARLEERLRLQLDQEGERRDMEEARFRQLASEIINSASERNTRDQSERLQSILSPLREHLDRVQRRVDECYTNEARERFSLQASIKQLVETNVAIGDEARRLARALRSDAKAQGDWGEMILEKILENSGLREGEEYMVQPTHDADGNQFRDPETGRLLRPDVVVLYPGGRSIVVDSKVSLSAFNDMVNAGDDSEMMADATQRHIISVRKHIKELADKSYHHLLGEASPDFVMMFIPNEGAYIALMNNAPATWQEAFDQHVLIVSPTHLISALKMVQQLWTQERRSRNVMEIAVEAGRLYDKFAGFIADIDRIKCGIDQTSKAYDSAVSKLKVGRGNIMNRFEKLRKLGAKTAKQLAMTDVDISDEPAEDASTKELEGE